LYSGDEMKIYFIIAVVAFAFSNFANAYYFTSAVPTKVVLVDGGLLVGGAFDTSGSTCATGNGIFLKNDDPDAKQFDRKLSMAMMAFASGKTLEVLIGDPVDVCLTVSAHGILPIVWGNYWIVK
ncbi:MAG: hypothetical protein RPS47_12025, partial [Colwellia sp.]